LEKREEQVLSGSKGWRWRWAGGRREMAQMYMNKCINNKK
jgi:hypothetical protein